VMARPSNPGAAAVRSVAADVDAVALTFGFFMRPET
jgi:hypothetical protein